MTMKNTKAGEEDTPLITLDVEYAVRMSALQEKMEQYYRRKKAAAERKIRKIKKQIKKYEYKLKNNIYKRTQ